MTTPTIIRALSTVALASTMYAHAVNGDSMHYLFIINVMALFGLVVTTLQDIADEEVSDDR